MKQFKNIELQGHRGARGLWPENSIYGFNKAIELGVDVIEMDVVVTGDKEILVSHDPFFHPLFCLDSEAKEIQNENDHNIYTMSFSEIQQFDCGLKFHHDFPYQEKKAVYKPLLKDVIIEADKKCNELGIVKVRFNIEIKSEERWYGNHQPDNVDEYVLLLLNVLKHLPPDRFNLQSFDINILRSLAKKAPKIHLAYLIEGIPLTSTNIDTLGFPLHAISPDYRLLTKEIVKGFKNKGVKVIPWTINEKEDMLRLANWGVDGIITDYPNRFMEVFKNFK